MAGEGGGGWLLPDRLRRAWGGSVGPGRSQTVRRCKAIGHLGVGVNRGANPAIHAADLGFAELIDGANFAADVTLNKTGAICGDVQDSGDGGGHGWLAVVVAGLSPSLYMVAGPLPVKRGKVRQFTDCYDWWQA